MHKTKAACDLKYNSPKQEGYLSLRVGINTSNRNNQIKERHQATYSEPLHHILLNFTVS